MVKDMKIGLIREGKTPPDARVLLAPDQVARLVKEQQRQVVVQPSGVRTFKDGEYQAAGISLQEDLSDCDLLLGIKEVPVDMLIPGKTYCFFSHTIKKQAYNRKLLRAVLDKRIRLIDYEVLTDDHGKRVIAFGFFAGMVGAHNGLWAYGKRTGRLSLPRLKDVYDYAEAKAVYDATEFPAIKIVLTGTGRVATGAAKVLDDMGIAKVSHKDFLDKSYPHAVYTQLECRHYVRHKTDPHFDKQHFYRHPTEYVSSFEPYTRVADLMINGIYWDNDAPAFFTQQDMAAPDFKIEVIADVTCDIAPVSSIPATLRASTIAEPLFGYDPTTGQETQPGLEHVIDMMTIDNLPSELPRDASTAFGEMFIEHVLPEFGEAHSRMLERATIAKDGHLGRYFHYLQDYVDGKE